MELISRALLDAELADRLFAEPEEIAKAFGLRPVETQAIKRLDRGRFEQRVVQLRSC